MVSFDGGSASKVDDVTALPSRHKMADMYYYGNVMTTTMSQHSDDVSSDSIALPMTVLLLLDVYTELVIDVFYIFNSAVID